MARRLLTSPTYREDVDRVVDLDLEWDHLCDSTLVVSGASGMIGSFLIDVLMTRNIAYGMNCTIHGFARSLSGLTERFQEYGGHENLLLHSIDLTTEFVGEVMMRDPQSAVSHVDYVIHAASNTHPVAYATHPIGTIAATVHGTHSMLDFAVRAKARRALFLSTVEIYGQNRGNGRFTETDLGYIDCNTLRAGYPESKRTGEALCQAFRAEYGLDVVIPRLPRVYGPTMRLDDTKAISQFLLDAVQNRDICLKSAGDQFYSYCHVADAVSAILTCLLRAQSGEAYNVADPASDVHLRDLARLVADTAGRSVIHDAPSATEQRGFSAATLAVMDGSKLARLGWKPAYSISGGVERTVDVLKEIVA